MAKIKLPFGLIENKILVHITDVESGKKCGCVCPSCKSPLIAVKGSLKQHHFRHDTGCECEKGLESAIHLAAKQVIMESKQITLPKLVYCVSKKDSKGENHSEEKAIIPDVQIVRFDLVEDEKMLDRIKADILATRGNAQLIIEIFYRHKVDEQKIEKIIKANISAIEIDLSDLTPEDVKDWDAFKISINDTKRGKWLYNSKSRDAYQELEGKLEKKLQKHEERYKQEEIKRQKKERMEKEKFLQAQEEVMVLRSEKNIMRFSQESETHPAWERDRRYLSVSWHELPDFLNVDVPDCDWIFGCDRRVWQAAFYRYFINPEDWAFTSKRVCEWLGNNGCKVPRAAQVVGIYGRKYKELVHKDLKDNLPFSRRTLNAYFNCLCDLGMLEFTGYDRKNSGSSWFKVISKNAPKVFLGWKS